jgi:dipeptidyl aminopeptidase/acylaminoacyl peptidase
MRGATVLCLVAMAVSLSAASAALTPVPIEGKLLVTGGDLAGVHSYFMDGSSDALVESPVFFDMGDVSPDMTKVAYTVRSISGLDHADWGDIWVANADGTGAVNLTGLAGLGGVNCAPQWSPDGGMIAFHHTTPAVGQRTCEAGFQIWLMSADGTGPHQWILAADHPTWWPSWTPDGHCLRAYEWDVGYITADTGAVTSPSFRTLPVAAPRGQVTARKSPTAR